MSRCTIFWSKCSYDTATEKWGPAPNCIKLKIYDGCREAISQIDEEALAITWSGERFHDLLIGIDFKTEAGHEPLISLLGSEDLEVIPPRVQRFRIRLRRFSYKIVYVTGKEFTSFRALSRAPIVREEKESQSGSKVFKDQIIID